MGHDIGGGAHTNLEIYSDAKTKNLKECEPSVDCLLIRDNKPGNTFSTICSETNCGLTNHWAPSKEVGIKVLYIGESPPADGTFIYDVESPVTKWFSRKIRRDLGNNLKSSDFQSVPTTKKELLEKMQKNGVLALDCCKCALNYDELGRKERNGIACQCYMRHTSEIIAAIHEKYSPLIRFAFPKKRGDPILKHLAGKYGKSVCDIRWV